MTNELKKKLEETKSEEELLSLLDSADPHMLSDDELELVAGGIFFPTEQVRG